MSEKIPPRTFSLWSVIRPVVNFLRRIFRFGYHVIKGTAGAGSGIDPGYLNTPAAMFPSSSTTGESTAGFYYNPPTLVDGAIYIGTSKKLHAEPDADNRFYKLDTKLNRIWYFPLFDREVRGAAVLDRDGNVYFVVERDRKFGDTSKSSFWLYSVTNPASGTAVLRDSQLSPSLNFPVRLKERVPHMGMIGPAIAPNPENPGEDIIYVGGDTLRAIGTDGTVLGELNMGNQSFFAMMTAPALDADGNVYFCADGNVYSVSTHQSGAMQIRWQTDFNYSGSVPILLSSPGFTSDYGLVIVAVHQTLYWIAAGDGKVLAQFRPEEFDSNNDNFRASVVVDDEDHVYVGTKCGHNGSESIYALMLSPDYEVRVKWKQTLNVDLYSTPVLGAGHILYTGSERPWDPGNDWQDRYVHGFDMHKGDHLGSYRVDADNMSDIVWSSAALSEEGILYIATMSESNALGAVYAFKTPSPGLLPGASWPRFHGGNGGTGVRGV